MIVSWTKPKACVHRHINRNSGNLLPVFQKKAREKLITRHYRGRRGLSHIARPSQPQSLAGGGCRQQNYLAAARPVVVEQGNSDPRCMGKCCIEPCTRPCYCRGTRRSRFRSGSQKSTDEGMPFFSCRSESLWLGSCAKN